MADTKPVIFKTYQTYGGYYVYDRHTNSVLTLSREEFEELQAVERGTSIAGETAEALTLAVEGAQNITSIVNKISTASNEQAQAIAQVTEGVDQISSVVQTNSATAQQSAAASEELSDQAQILKDFVSRFRIRN